MQIAQILFKVLVVYYRIGDPMVDFVDLCWLSNISMIILDNCSGFYIHGQVTPLHLLLPARLASRLLISALSVAPGPQFTGKYVDTDARTLNRELLQPHNDMRGFIHGNEDQVQVGGTLPTQPFQRLRHLALTLLTSHPVDLHDICYQ